MNQPSEPVCTFLVCVLQLLEGLDQSLNLVSAGDRSAIPTDKTLEIISDEYASDLEKRLLLIAHTIWCWVMGQSTAFSFMTCR